MIVRKLLVILFLVSITTVTLAQTPSNNQAVQALPPTLGGFNVLATFASGETVCVLPNTFRIVLQATEPNAHAFLQNTRVSDVRRDINQLRIQGVTNYQISIVGPGATAAGIRGGNAAWNRIMGRHGCTKLSPFATGSDGGIIPLTSGSAGRAIFENVDAGSYTDDNAQSVLLTAPNSVGANNYQIDVMNNVMTDVDDYLIQTGLQISGTEGVLMWSSTSQGYVPQIIDTEEVPYVATHQYWFGISYSDEVWWVCYYDTSDLGTYNCIYDEYATGDDLKLDPHTGIWFENYNRNSDWYDGFGDFEIFAAKLHLDGVPQDWSEQHRHTAHACTASYPPADAMSGTLVGAEVAYFEAEYLPLRCIEE